MLRIGALLFVSTAVWTTQVAWSQAGIITTIAGGGSLAGNAANGAQATNVRLTGSPLNVTTDRAGNVYVVDGRAARVWKVNPLGVITTFAGGGTAPGSGDGGPATNAQITASGVAVDSAGNVYISGAVVRKVNPSGVISTIAQVNATNVAIDGAGNLYLADILANQIKKVDPAGNVTVTAGSGAQGYTGDGGPAVDASLVLPQGVSTDAAGNVYFCDAGNARVRKVDTAGIITTVAGNGSPLSIGDGGPATRSGMTPTATAVDREGSLYIADTGSSRIRKVNTAGNISTVAGGALPINTNLGDGGPATSAWLSGPRCVWVDNDLNIYICDDNNLRIRKVSSGVTGVTLRITPETLSFSYTPGGPAPAAQTVVVISPGATLTYTAAPATASGGNWLSVSPTSGPANTTLTISVNPAGVPAGIHNGSIVITPSGEGNAPQTVAVRLTVNAPASQGIITTVAGNGFLGFSTEGAAATSTAIAANGLAVDAGGNLYIASIVDSRVLRVSPSGTVSTFAGNGALTYAGDGGPATRGSFWNVTGVAADSSGNVHMADSQNQRIRRVNTGGVIATIAGNGSPGFSGDGGQATSAALNTPMAVATDSTGNIYIADYANSRIRRVSPAGIITTVAGGALLPGFSGDGGRAVGAALNFPGGVAVDAPGNLYIADMNNHRIRKVDTAGTITTVAGNGTKGFSGDGGPATAAALNLFGTHAGLAVDTAGNLYIPDIANHRVRKVDTAGIITTVAGNGIAGFSGDGGPATSAGLNNPTDVGVDAAGALYIADTTNNRVRKVTAPASTNAPAIASNGVVNGASFQPGIVSNSWVTIQGTSLAPGTNTWANAIVNGNLPTSLDRVTVTIGGKPGYLYYVSPSQINLIAPDIPAGATQVTVTTPSGASSTYTVNASLFGPAFFLWPSQQVVATRQDFSFAARNGTFAGAQTVAAKPGEVIILWGTGFGPTAPAAPTGVQIPSDRTYSTTTLPVVTVNHVAATVYGAALAPGFAGLCQVAIQVPATLTDGDWAVTATIEGVSSAPGTILAVRR
jgi:uncharacterized protein (TIGR03437 family)